MNLHLNNVEETVTNTNALDRNEISSLSHEGNSSSQNDDVARNIDLQNNPHLSTNVAADADGLVESSSTDSNLHSEEEYSGFSEEERFIDKSLNFLHAS